MLVIRCVLRRYICSCRSRRWSLLRHRCRCPMCPIQTDDLSIWVLHAQTIPQETFHTHCIFGSEWRLPGISANGWVGRMLNVWVRKMDRVVRRRSRSSRQRREMCSRFLGFCDVLYRRRVSRWCRGIIVECTARPICVGGRTVVNKQWGGYWCGFRSSVAL